MGRMDTIVRPDTWMPRGEALCLSTRPPMAIWQGIPGERAEVHIYHVGRNRLLARWNRAIDGRNPNRVEPPCSRYSSCGGCPLMHLNRRGQYSARLDMLREALGVLKHRPPVDRVVPSPDGLSDYRHVVKLAVGYTDIGRIRLGAFGRNSRDIVPVPDCLAVTPTLRRAMKAVSHHVIHMRVMPYDHNQRRGLIRYVVLRQSRASGQLLVTLVAVRWSRILEDLAQEISLSLPEVTGVHLHVNNGPGNAIFNADGTGVVGTRKLNGQSWLEEEVLGNRLRLGPGDFFQTNPAVAHLLYREVVSNLLRDRPLLDLYCGIGGIALGGIRKTGWAMGVELNSSAVDRARESASINRLPAEFTSGLVQDELPEIGKRITGVQPNVVVNPARRGLEEGVVDRILEVNPARVIYVSCNPRTMAMDLARFEDSGYLVKKLVPFDMFPNTSHMELVAVMDGKNVETTSRAGRKRGPRRRMVR